MNRLAPLALPACLLMLGGCSPVKVETRAQASPERIAEGRKYFLRVQTGNGMLNQFLYEYTFQEMGRYLALVEKEAAANGTVDILFTTEADRTVVSNGAKVGAVKSWYTGLGSAVGLGASASHGTAKVENRQKGTMIAAIKTRDGERLWWANLDLTGKDSVATPSEAARYMAKELGSAMAGAGFKPLAPAP